MYVQLETHFLFFILFCAADKRQQYDNGFDPNDIDQGNNGGGGGQPFQHQQGGFNFQNGFPFGGGGQGFPAGGHSFKMHF